eukprot:scaffold67335_cov32-Attheya_sp.AAC.1
MLSRPVDWQTFFADRDTDVSVNTKMKGLEGLFSEDLSNLDCVKLLKDEDDAVFLTINPINQKVSIAHHFNQFGGTRTQPIALYSAMIGFDHQASAVMIDISSLLQGAKIRVPTWDTLKACKSISSLKDLVAPAAPAEGADSDDEEAKEGEGATFEEVYFRNLVIPPPFLAHILVDSGSRDPCELIIDSMNAISAFDTRHAEDQEMPSTTEALVHIVQFLWAAAKGLVRGSPFLTAEEPCYAKWSSTIHKECLAETPAVLLQQQNQHGQVSDATMHSIASSISIQGQTLEKIHELRKDSTAESKKSYNLLHPVRVHLILNASSTDGSTVSVDPSIDAQSFYKCKTVGAAKIHLEHSLVHVHKCLLHLSV